MRNKNEKTAAGKIMTEPQGRRIALAAAGAVLFLGGIALIWFLTPSFFNTEVVTGRMWKAALFILGAAFVLLGWNLFADGTEVIEYTDKKIVIRRALRGEVILPVDHIQKVRLRRKKVINPLRGMPGRKALSCFMEAREGAYITLLDGKTGQEDFIAFCARKGLLKEGSDQELAWYRGETEQ